MQFTDEDQMYDFLQADFCSLRQANIPTSVLEEGRIDTQWHLIGQLEDSKYKKLFTFKLLILTIPHSNAECERIFSFVTKIATQFRASLSNDWLVGCLIYWRKCSERLTAPNRHFICQLTKLVLNKISAR